MKRKGLRASLIAIFRFGVLACALLLGPRVTAKTNDAAKLSISGFGWLGNRELKRTITILQGTKSPPRYYDANFVEDAALILLSKVSDDGYLRPRVTSTLTLSNGTVQRFEWDLDLNTVLPRPLLAAKVRFRIKRGVRFYYRRLEIIGLQSLPDKRARAFFMETDLLIPIKGTRVYTPSRLERSVSSLKEALARRGFADASVSVAHLDRDERSGAVDVRIEVNEGLPTRVRSLSVQVHSPGGTTNREPREIRPGRAYSRFWVQDIAQGIRTNHFRRGFPDATVEIAVTNRQVGDASIEVDLLATVETGSRVQLGQVQFEGDRNTRESVLKRRVKLKQGTALNPMEVERGRERLARLGIFDSVQVRYVPQGPTTRDVIYMLEEGKVIDFSLLFGYGSYELLRGGFELERRNLWGLAHQTRLRAIQSFKASSADFLYTIPDILYENVNLFFNGTGLRRDEVSFVREEYGGGFGLQQFVRALDSELSLRYTYQVLNASDAQESEIVGLREARVAAWVFDIKHDRRDNPLLPHQGFKVFSTAEFASAALGGEVDYQRLELGSSFHQPLGGGRFLHLGLSHGAIVSSGSREEDLPFNKRFFPGGENSIRGYQQGEASPRNADGKVIGAETYLLGNAEFEQVLTPAWSLVFLFDAVGFAATLRDYPLTEALYSAGGGLRWKTPIGPARIEYGHNLNPRKRDPVGTLHFSLGFPF
jgi:outer membrane protein insertion porin family